MNVVKDVERGRGGDGGWRRKSKRGSSLDLCIVVSHAHGPHPSSVDGDVSAALRSEQALPCIHHPLSPITFDSAALIFPENTALSSSFIPMSGRTRAIISTHTKRWL